jgi:tetratricopeptide (TPR) repeat protein
MEFERWKGSHHDAAMQEANSKTVLGDFSGVTFGEGSAQVRFSSRDGEFVVSAIDAAEQWVDFAVRHTFGVEPLQQYLIAAADGRMQALTVAWDSRPADGGGQRWFSLYPDEDTPPGDVLHFGGAANNWNAQCAACHSTRLRKNFDAATGRYATRWAELNVACEACHGAGSRHVAWANADAGARGDDPRLPVNLALERGANWIPDPASGIARRSAPRRSHAELESCAACHSRRGRIAEEPPEGRFMDGHRPALLEEGLYFADGQILDEVYVYGSFLQSKMFRAGVGCSDCHEPHSLRLRDSPGSVCAQCHDSARFATPTHHHHEPGSAGARCENCHMPARTYMQIDVRHDHSFRVPRPDLSESLGVPNACAACHGERPARWAAAAIERWSGHAPGPHFGEILQRGRRGDRSALEPLRRLAADTTQPGIVRATSLQLLERYQGTPIGDTVAAATTDADPLLRLAAVRAAAALGEDRRSRQLARLLDDPLRAIRIDAARALAPLSRGRLSAPERRSLQRALREYYAAEELDADQPRSHVNLGLLHRRRSALGRAEAAYREAIRVGDYFVPAYLQLADLYRMLGRDSEAEPLLRRALEVAPESADAHHALGLHRVRMQRHAEALGDLRRACELAPENPRFAYVYAIALHGGGQTEAALDALHRALERRPGSRDLTLALATLHRDVGQRDEAARYARALLLIDSEDPAARGLLEELGAR